MSRNSTSAIGALHPVFFMLLVYIISIVLAFFVCRMIYASIHTDETALDTNVSKEASMTVLK